MQFELDNLFISKHKRIFEINPYTTKVGRWTKRTIHIAASICEKTMKKRHEEKVQLAINLGLNTLKIVRFVMSNSSTL